MTETGPSATGAVTDNFGFQKPTVGGDEDSWGSDYTTGDPAADPSPGLNGNWSKIDVLLQSMQDEIDELRAAAVIRVDGVYLTTEVFADGEAVAAALGYGEWVAHAEGRALVGVGTSNTTIAQSWAVNQEIGLEHEALATSQLPAHTHNVGSIAANLGNAGNNNSTYFELASNEDNNMVIVAAGSFVESTPLTNGRYASTNAGTSTRERVTLNWLHNHTVSMSGTSANTGDGGPHNNLQPSIGVYVWKRTA